MDRLAASITPASVPVGDWIVIVLLAASLLAAVAYGVYLSRHVAADRRAAAARAGGRAAAAEGPTVPGASPAEGAEQPEEPERPAVTAPLASDDAGAAC